MTRSVMPLKIGSFCLAYAVWSKNEATHNFSEYLESYQRMDKTV